MLIVRDRTPRPSAVATTDDRILAPGEIVAIAFFAYLATFGFYLRLPVLEQAVLCGIPVVLWGAWRAESACRRKWSEIARDWSSLALVLLAYWLLEWFATPPLKTLEARWIHWDRLLLTGFALRPAIERFGPLLPSVLETVYLGLYALPCAALGVIYGLGKRSKADRFLFVLFLGTLSAYALLPLWPVESPRVAFRGEDLPAFGGYARQVNTWLLDHMDISTGVFPSGHVAVAFSTAFGLLSVFPTRRSVWLPAFGAASLVYIATVYGRYHYAFDGLASMAIAALAWAAAEVFNR